MCRKINYSHSTQLDYLNASTETELFTLNKQAESLGTDEQSCWQRKLLLAICIFQHFYCKDVKTKFYNQSLVLPKPAAWSSNRCQAGRDTAPYYHLASNYWARWAHKEAQPWGRTDAASEQTALRMDNTTDVREHITHITLFHLLHHWIALLWHNKKIIKNTLLPRS